MLFGRYINKNITKHIKCEMCLNSLKPEYGQVVAPEADLVNLKTRVFLIHPNKNVYMLTKLIEMCFEKHAESPNVFEDTYEEFFSKNIRLTFPCSEHKSDVLTNIFNMYIVMRMRQFTYSTNQQNKKQNKF